MFFPCSDPSFAPKSHFLFFHVPYVECELKKKSQNCLRLVILVSLPRISDLGLAAWFGMVFFRFPSFLDVLTFLSGLDRKASFLTLFCGAKVRMELRKKSHSCLRQVKFVWLV